MLHEVNKTRRILNREQKKTGNRKSIEITEVVKQGLIFGPTKCCATTTKVNDVGVKVDYKYREIEQV